ncbi:hypothetical protein [uncultured Roseibium sp.]|uniref:hypothetical protein n=1 Tax=uncultured Roseibium sp. TaxID=1936171 RepID=UPI002637E67C|nr:hypothetical protein [uncultured Roseibium sp.]
MVTYAAATSALEDYNENSAHRLKDIDEHGELLRELALRTFNIAETPKVADFGCGPGLCSLKAVRPVLETWAGEAPRKQLSACFADLPGNDWGVLRETVFGQQGLVSGHNVPQIEMLAGDFYNQMLSGESVSLAISFFATHWLRNPVYLQSQNAFWFSDLQAHQYQRLRQVAMADFALFVKKRVNELVPGGSLLVSTLGSSSAETAPNGIVPSNNVVVPFTREVLQDMVADGILDQVFLNNFLFPVWYLTKEDARQAILQNEELAASCDIELVQVRSRSREESDPYARFLDQPEVYARKKMLSDRPILQTTLEENVFRRCAQSPEELRLLSEEFFSRMERAILSDVLAGPYRRHIERKRVLTVVLRKKLTQC